MRKEIQTNFQYVDVLNEWDPFQLKNGSYETEIADVIQALHELNDCAMLAKRIQTIYEFSFEKLIPIENCVKIAAELLAIKINETCSF
ncbi:DUF1871 family protein [Neobacillus sp. NPDC093127]|uniref:DUF1871 family protein n=1 Tax=Neobacillus sp. NPDC093127 TaxID=3364296 RepID=UPI00382D2029